MNGSAMLIRGAETSGPAVTQLAKTVWPATQDKAIFTHYGNQYFLHTVSVAAARPEAEWRNWSARAKLQSIANFIDQISPDQHRKMAPLFFVEVLVLGLFQGIMKARPSSVVSLIVMPVDDFHFGSLHRCHGFVTMS
jgi:hypothetical protein